MRIWEYMLIISADGRNVMYNQMPELTGVKADEAFTARWDRIHALRDDVQKAWSFQKGKVIGKSLEASVTLYCGGELYDFVKSVEEELKPCLSCHAWMW